MAPAHGHLDGPFGLELAADVGKIFSKTLFRGFLKQRAGVVCGGLQSNFAPEKLNGLAEGAHAVDGEALDERGFGGVGRGQQEHLAALSSGGQRDRQGALHGTHRPVQGEFPHDTVLRKVREGGVLTGADESDGNWQVEGGPFFAHIGRGEVDGGASLGPVKQAVGNGGGDPVPALAHGGVRKPDNHNRHQPARGVDFDLHLQSVHPLYRRRENLCQHTKESDGAWGAAPANGRLGGTGGLSESRFARWI